MRVPAPAELATADRRPSGRRGVEFRESWMFKGDAVERILAMLEGAPRPWVHVCCGAGRIPGEDLRVDLYHPSADKKWDVFDLDRHLGATAGAIIIDPPYNWDLGSRQKAMNACMRALQPGGVLIVHSPWQPRFPVVAPRREPIYFRDDAALVDWPLPFVVLAAYDKTTDARVLKKWWPRVFEEAPDL